MANSSGCQTVSAWQAHSRGSARDPSQPEGEEPQPVADGDKPAV
ncbi:hypothetical protein ACR0Q7_09935 [Enterococcus faecalis]